MTLHLEDAVFFTCPPASVHAMMRFMDKVPEETKEPSFRLWPNGITLEEIAFQRTKLTVQEKRAKVGEAFQDAFELVGGIPRLALEADANYGEFIKLYARMIPRDIDMKHSGEIRIIPALPPSALDGEFEDVTNAQATLEHLPGDPLETSLTQEHARATPNPRK